jgi:hypothetical protein
MFDPREPSTAEDFELLAALEASEARGKMKENEM